MVIIRYLLFIKVAKVEKVARVNPLACAILTKKGSKMSKIAFLLLE